VAQSALVSDPAPPPRSEPSNQPERPSSLPPVQYKGADLEAARGPGLGCFWLQLIALGVLVVATPLSVSAGAPSWVSAVLLFATLGLLLFAGQTVIFLLRLVAADRREGRRRPMAARSATVGQLEDKAGAAPTEAREDGSPAPDGVSPAPETDHPGDDPVRQ
jgi:hypothetical protein